MIAVSPRNPNLCLSCEQLVEDASAELERLLSAPERSRNAASGAPGLMAEAFCPDLATLARPSVLMLREPSDFVAPA